MEGVFNSALPASDWHAGAFAPCGYDGASVSAEVTNNGQKPAYCYSLGYRLGNAVDKGGTAAQYLGAGAVVVGAGTVVVSWWTGAGAVTGGAIVAGGADAYNFGTGLKQVGNMIKAASGQSLDVTAANMLEIPSMGIKGAAARILADQAGQQIGRFAKDPCE